MVTIGTMLGSRRCPTCHGDLTDRPAAADRIECPSCGAAHHLVDLLDPADRVPDELVIDCAALLLIAFWAFSAVLLVKAVTRTVLG